MTKQDTSRQRMLDEHALAHRQGNTAQANARYQAEVALRGAKRLLAGLPSYAQLDAAHEARKAGVGRVLDRQAASVPAPKLDARAKMRAYNERVANAPVGFADDTGLAEYLQAGKGGGKSFAPPSQGSLSSAVNLGAASALLEVRVKELQDILRENASAIQQVEKAQIRLEEARQALEQAIAKHPATDTAKPDAASEYIARMRDPYSALRLGPKRN